MALNMSAIIYYRVPRYFDAGTTVKFTRTFQDYLASGGWEYTIYIAGAVILSKQATVNADGISFDVTLAPADTASLNPGANNAVPVPAVSYDYVERVSNGTDVFEVGRGVIDVGLNIATAKPGDAVTHEERALAIIDAAIEGRLDADTENYHLNGVSINKIPVKELISLRGIYAGKVWRQRHPGELGPPVHVRFPWDYYNG